MHKNTFVDIHELHEFYEQQEKDAVLLDVRTQEEWDAGHVPGATHIPLDELESRVGEIRGAPKIYIYCRRGRRAQTAFEILREQEVENMWCVNGGGMDHWVEAGYPVED